LCTTERCEEEGETEKDALLDEVLELKKNVDRRQKRYHVPLDVSRSTTVVQNIYPEMLQREGVVQREAATAGEITRIYGIHKKSLISVNVM